MSQSFFDCGEEVKIQTLGIFLEDLDKIAKSRGFERVIESGKELFVSSINEVCYKKKHNVD